MTELPPNLNRTMARRFQFSLRALLLLILSVAMSLGWLVQRRKTAADEQAISMVLSKGGMIGSNHDQSVNEVVFAGQRGDVDLGTNITDADLEALLTFGSLQKLDLTGRPITNAAVPTLSRLTRLRVLKISGTKISRDGFDRLRAALPGCDIQW